MVMISTTVDGVAHSDEVEPRLLLVYYLRERLEGGDAGRLRHVELRRLHGPDGWGG